MDEDDNHHGRDEQDDGDDEKSVPIGSEHKQSEKCKKGRNKTKSNKVNQALDPPSSRSLSWRIMWCSPTPTRGEELEVGLL